ncbi:unnamed protein product, partial [Symbiodinium microadriaticum]
MGDDLCGEGTLQKGDLQRASWAPWWRSAVLSILRWSLSSEDIETAMLCEVREVFDSKTVLRALTAAHGDRRR